MPAGKVESNEPYLQAAVRELGEESGIKLAAHDVKNLGKLSICNPKGMYDYYMFYKKLDAQPVVKLNNEHTEFIWAEPEEVCSLPLIMGAKEALEIVLKRR